jgi:spermidine synthase
VLSALAFGQRAVTGVEINGSILDVLNAHFGEFTGRLDRDPRVTFVNDEARSYIARQQQRFNILQISLIDTWAATGACAIVPSAP